MLASWITRRWKMRSPRRAQYRLAKVPRLSARSMRINCRTIYGWCDIRARWLGSAESQAAFGAAAENSMRAPCNGFKRITQKNPCD